MALVIAGYQLPNDSTTALTRANLNLMGVPTVTIQNGEIVDSMVTSVSGSKVLAGTLPLSALTTAAQSRATGGVKNYLPNPQFDLWDSASPITMATGTFASTHGHWYNNANATTIPGTITQTGVTPGLSDSLLGNAKWWYQVATTGTGAVQIIPVEFIIPNARLFSGQAVTLSLIGQVFSGTLPTISAAIVQSFGTGGSPSGGITTAATFNTQPIGTVGQSYANFTMPSVSGKTFGTNGDDYLLVQVIVASCTTAFTLGIANAQLELGNLATTFENSLSRNTGFDANINNGVMQGRLTLISGDPYMLTGDVASASTVYWSPVNGNRVTLWDGNNWREVPVPEISFSMAGSANSSVYDLFGYYNGSTMAIEKLVWTNATTRATAVTLQDGVWCKSGDKTRRLLGTFATNASGVCSVVRTASGVAGGNTTAILLDNVYNKIPTSVTIQETTASWVYNSVTWRAFNGSVSPNYNNTTVVQSLNIDQIDFLVEMSTNGAWDPMFGIGTANNSVLSIPGASVNVGGNATEPSMYVTFRTTALGLNTYYLNERNRAAGGNSTFFGNSALTPQGFVTRKNF